MGQLAFVESPLQADSDGWLALLDESLHRIGQGCPLMRQGISSVRTTISRRSVPSIQPEARSFGSPAFV
jgi:hypothetical protein